MSGFNNLFGGAPPGGDPDIPSIGLDTVNGVVYVTGASNTAGWNPPMYSAASGLTAHAGGGQANATAITTQVAQFSTVATLNDSSVLPKALAGMRIVVMNSGAASMNVFPASGETINALSANTAFAVANGKTAMFVSPVNGKWFSILTA